MLNSISVSRVQPLAPPSPTLKHACLLCTLGSVLTAFPSFSSQITSTHQALAYWWHGYSDYCCIGPITTWLLQLLIFQHVMFLYQQAPACPKSLITSYVPPRLLRSSDQCLLTQPRTRACIGQRAFSVCAPSVWNSLPLSIRLSPALATFKRNLKTFYFAPS